MGKYIVELKKNETLYKAATRESDGTAYVCSAIGTPYTVPDLEQARKEAYQRGLSDAWEAARKIAYMYSKERRKIFGEIFIQKIQSIYSASEAIEKIRQYEQEKEEQIQVGDEIETPSGLKGYVVNFTDDELVHYVSSEGRFGTMGMSAVSKTGRHFPEIAEALQKMKES